MNNSNSRIARLGGNTSNRNRNISRKPSKEAFSSRDASRSREAKNAETPAIARMPAKAGT